jgi:hypothetical protein
MHMVGFCEPRIASIHARVEPLNGAVPAASCTCSHDCGTHAEAVGASPGLRCSLTVSTLLLPHKTVSDCLKHVLFCVLACYELVAEVCLGFQLGRHHITTW